MPIFNVSCEEKGYYRVVSMGQLGFDSRSYCGRSRRVQGYNAVFTLLVKVLDLESDFLNVLSFKSF